ncbi:MAG TPA: DinB family protein, partial [Acidobacteriota bacterium]|nr:DinB family protein [Acidobacteriota bacterium]
ELGWADRCGGPKRGPRLNPADFPTVESLVERWNTVEANIREFLSTLTDDDLTRMVEYPNDRGELLTMPLGELLQHAANHAVHHRGQVALLLRMLGQSPGNFDILIYFAEKRGVRAW